LVKPYTGNLEIKLINAFGLVVYQQKIVSVNRREFQINRDKLPAGTYIFEVKRNDIIQTEKIILQ
jgi:hypothetical protein